MRFEQAPMRHRSRPQRTVTGRHDASIGRLIPFARDIYRLLGLMSLALLTGAASAEPSSPPDSTASSNRPSVCANFTTQDIQGYKVPGRKPGSQEPWELFLGNASHRLIAYIYRTRHPTNLVFDNKVSIKTIIARTGIGDSSRLPENEHEIRPDITDISVRNVFEIKPHNEPGLRDGLRKIEIYLLALNRSMSPDTQFSGGKKFEGEVLIQFAQGQYIWRLEWCTTTPGVTQYRWTRSQERFDSNAAAYNAKQWVVISEQELKQYGRSVAQAVEAMVDRRERVATLGETLGMAIDIVGEVAMIVISTATSGERGTAQPGGKLLPFPSKPSSTAPAGQLPRASGM
ncbi:hypothetical protein F0U60_02470 [Archangium minus]|uniref:Uncharacterized protein n=1 Tax=Archangium minus TaxID=83450 RepID=A0ABY9WIS0_9BACT|nr:hypothetical protein F0U60_02470 [Archangium minus]